MTSASTQKQSMTNKVDMTKWLVMSEIVHTMIGELLRTAMDELLQDMMP